MRFGMNLQLWTVHPTAAEHGHLLEQLRGWGFDGVEFPIGGLNTREVEKLKRITSELGLACTAIQGLDASQADPASANVKLREAAVWEMKRAVEKTAALGTSLLSGPLFEGLGRHPEKPPTRDEWDRSVDVIREAAEYAATMDIRLALEPLNRFEMSLVNTAADGARFCRETGMENVGLLVDTHHANIEEADPAHAWQSVSDRIMHVHISENDRGVPGRGHAIKQDALRALHAAGYNGWLTIEAFGLAVEPLIPRLALWRQTFQRPEEVAVEGLKFIRERWQQVVDEASSNE